LQLHSSFIYSYFLRGKTFGVCTRVHERLSYYATCVIFITYAASSWGLYVQIHWYFTYFNE